MRADAVLGQFRDEVANEPVFAKGAEQNNYSQNPNLTMDMMNTPP
jgi:hypothetical protein